MLKQGVYKGPRPFYELLLHNPFGVPDKSSEWSPPLSNTWFPQSASCLQLKPPRVSLPSAWVQANLLMTFLPVVSHHHHL